MAKKITTNLSGLMTDLGLSINLKTIAKIMCISLAFNHLNMS